MKFGVKLEKRTIPEWKDAYVNYDILKRFLKPYRLLAKLYSKVIEKNKSTETVLSQGDLKDDLEKLTLFEDDFNELLDADFERINHFFELKQLELLREYYMVKANIVIFDKSRLDGAYQNEDLTVENTNKKQEPSISEEQNKKF